VLSDSEAVPFAESGGTLTMKPRTLNDIFFSIVERKHERLMLVREASQWSPISSQEFYRNVAGMARALTQLGLAKGDRLAILSENRHEWAVTDFACLLVGAVVVPIYSTLTAQQTAYILNDSGAKVVVVSTQDQLKKVLSIKDQTALEKVVVMDPVENQDAVPMRHLMHEGPTERDPELESRARSIAADDLASIIYTSGTTGTSKGVQLSHGNLTSNVLNSMDGFEVEIGRASCRERV
jgi:long-chain acyl-CoA synthetase